LTTAYALNEPAAEVRSTVTQPFGIPVPSRISREPYCSQPHGGSVSALRKTAEAPSPAPEKTVIRSVTGSEEALKTATFVRSEGVERSPKIVALSVVASPGRRPG